MFEANDDNPAIVEAVLYRYPTYEERTVICCSTMSGCPVGCTFCGTGRKFVRNLTDIEIVSQIMHILNEINVDVRNIKKLQIMFMSMGEPMLNYNNLEKAIRRLNYLYPNAQLLVSTSAPVVDELILLKFANLSKEIDKIGLQVSVHESTDENRAKLIPTKTMKLADIAKYGGYWYTKTERKPYFNYCVHANNSSQQDVDNLKKKFNPFMWEVTLSVICEKDETMKSSIDRQLKLIKEFNQKMVNVGYSTRTFNPAGQDTIGGGCGQLHYVQKWFNSHNV